MDNNINSLKEQMEAMKQSVAASVKDLEQKTDDKEETIAQVSEDAKEVPAPIAEKEPQDIKEDSMPEIETETFDASFKDDDLGLPEFDGIEDEEATEAFKAPPGAPTDVVETAEENMQEETVENSPAEEAIKGEISLDSTETQEEPISTDQTSDIVLPDADNFAEDTSAPGKEDADDLPGFPELPADMAKKKQMPTIALFLISFVIISAVLLGAYFLLFNLGLFS